MAFVVACGGSGGGNGGVSGSTQTIDIEMRDIAFSPAKVEVQSGETVRFAFHNTGKVTHDAFIGEQQAQRDHEKEMREDGADSGMSGMDHGGSDEGGVTVKAGKTGHITHTFKAGDALLIGCHEAGHYASGMKITITTT